jgi:hypothetical protein
MKKIILLFALILGVNFLAQAQDEIPQNVLDKFAEKFKSAEEPYWYADEEQYVVEFTSKGSWMQVVFDQAAEITKTQKNLEETALPANIQAMLKAKFEDNEISEIQQIKEKDQDLYYLINLETPKEYCYLKLDAKGKILSDEREAKEVNTTDWEDEDDDEDED